MPKRFYFRFPPKPPSCCPPPWLLDWEHPLLDVYAALLQKADIKFEVLQLRAQKRNGRWTIDVNLDSLFEQEAEPLHYSVGQVTAETKEEEENTKGTEGPGEEEEPEQDPTVEPGAEAADPAAQPSSGRVIADFITSPEGIKTGWEVRGIHAKYTPQPKSTPKHLGGSR